MRRLLLVLVLFVLFVLPEGCGSGEPDPGPLDFSAGSIVYCAPAEPGSAVTFGNIYLDNDDPLTLIELSFTEIDGLTLLGTDVAPEDVPGVAGWHGYPPQGAPDITDESWAASHRPLNGAIIGSDTEIISIRLRLDRPRGVARTPLLDYELDGERYRVEIPRTYELRRRC